MGALSPSRHVRARPVLWAPIFVLQCYGHQHLPSDMNPDGNIRQPLWSRRKLMSSIVMNLGPLRHLLPVGSWLGTLARRTIRRSRMGRDHLLNEARAWPYQDQRTCYPWHCLSCQGDSVRGRGGPNIVEGSPWPLVFLHSPICKSLLPLGL